MNDSWSSADCYLLKVPFFLWTVENVSTLILATILTLDEAALGLNEGALGRHYFLLAWLTTLLIHEVRVAWADLGFWLTDPRNLLEALGVALATNALLWSSDYTLAPGLSFLWSGKLMRICSLSSTFGPLVLMLEDMVRDVAKWSVLALALIIAIAGCMLVVFRPGDSNLGCEHQLLFDPVGNETTSLSDAATGLLENVIFFVVVALAPHELHEHCFSEATHPVAARFISMFYLLLMNVLMMNMCAPIYPGSPFRLSCVRPQLGLTQLKDLDLFVLRMALYCDTRTLHRLASG